MRSLSALTVVSVAILAGACVSGRDIDNIQSKLGEIRARQEATLQGMNALVGETAGTFKKHIEQTAAASLMETNKASLLQSS